MTTHLDAIPIGGKRFRNGPVRGEEKGSPAIQDQIPEQSAPHVLLPTLASRARHAFRWTGICLMVEVAVVAILASIGLLTGMTAGHHLFWALGVGFCLATPPCIVAAVVTAEIIEDEFHDAERRGHGAM